MPAAPSFDCYEALGVSRDATDAEIKASWKRLALAHHPDKNPDNVEEATEKMHRINAAYDAIKDAASRQAYQSGSSASTQSSSHNGDYGFSHPFDGSHDWAYARYTGGDNEDGFFGFNIPPGFSFWYRSDDSAGAAEPDAEERYRERARETFAQMEKEADERARLHEEKMKREAKIEEERQEKARVKEQEKMDKQTAHEKKQKEELVQQEQIFVANSAKTTQEKQACCKHSEFWPKEKQSKKVKCGECGQKRGMLAFKCPYCALLVCQVCVTVLSSERAEAGM